MDRLKAMVVGLDGIGKRVLASNVIEASKEEDVELDVLVTNELPLKDSEEKADYLVFIVDMRSRLSFERLHECIVHVERQYALGRSCLVVVNSETPAKFSFALEEVYQFAQAYGMDLQFCTIEDKASLSSMGKRIVHACVNTSRRNGVSPLFSVSLDTDLARRTTFAVA